MRLLFVICYFLICNQEKTYAQVFEQLTEKNGISFRGLATYKENVIWVSGNKGTVGRSIDGGITWNWINPAGYENMDFRDIQSFSKEEAVIMSAGSPAIILHTNNGGKSWKEVYRDDQSEIFLDGMDFQGKLGFAYGDPIDGYFQLLKSTNKGKTWKDVTHEMYVIADEGEAGFAASGTSIKVLNNLVWIGTGGRYSSLFKRNEKALKMDKMDVPLLSGKESTGIFSIDFIDDNTGIVVGGDYMQDKDNSNNVLITKNGGENWIKPEKPVFGYRSCVLYIDRNLLLATGTSGTDISKDGGNTWNNIDQGSFNVIAKTPSGKQVYLAGSNGNIVRIKL